MSDTGPRKFTHDASDPAVLVFLKDGMIQKAVLYGPAVPMVYVREDGRGGFGIVPTEIAADFVAFDDILTLEPEQLAAEARQDVAAIPPLVIPEGGEVAITIKAK